MSNEFKMYFHNFYASHCTDSILNQSNNYSLFFSCITETWILSYKFPEYILKLSQVKVTKRAMFLSFLFKETLYCSFLPRCP